MAWERGKQRLQKALAGLLEMPKDVLMDYPKVTMIGNVQLVLENHRGIVEYTEERIRVLVTGGQLEIFGEKLVLRTILPEELMVEGRIHQVHFPK
ncbi:sporulation protein YqfC [Heliobacillus mobilis]|uniref:Sporulation protein YqfC n=2 Tax=Heliobacterium TaxID=2697 RepID=A0A6I3SN38_HELMO|nr:MULTISPECIES: sporulation protein YqfC [Heliobacterium]MBC9785043.1 sporulation protein YqfC [Heliobacterium chlorum]MTV50145.1 sporulation protein YqfC [Heliobacterium mobile]